MQYDSTITQRKRRHARVRARVVGTNSRPRLAVYKSNRVIHAQLIDDVSGRSLVGVVSASASAGKTKTMEAHAAGTLLAELAAKHNISLVTFDRGGFQYHGRVRAFAEGARAGGLVF
jgi:large subunit ribosomal protein L18